MIYNICGFYGHGNLGDEGILYAIVDEIRSIDRKPAIIVSTTLPDTQRDKYLERLREPIPEILAVRDTYDTRSDYDIFLLGGGNLNWGYGWRLALSAFASGKRCMNYGVGYTQHAGSSLYHPKLNRLYYEFLSQFNVVTVRDHISEQLLRGMGVKAHLTMCPGINLATKETGKGFYLPFTLESATVVCPRFEDSDQYGVPGNNIPQIDFLINRLKSEPESNIILLPLSPGDMTLCQEIRWEIPNKSIIFYAEDPRMAKLIISKTKKLISGGRYHAVLWAIAHDVPYELVPTGIRYEKVPELIQAHRSTPSKQLRARELENVRLLRELIGS